MMSQRDDKDEEEFSNWAKTVLGLKKARDGSINHIKSKIQPFVDKLYSNHSVHFKELLIKVAVNAEVKKLHLGRKNATELKWVLDSNTCTTCEKIFEDQIDILEKSWCSCKKWLKSSTKEQVEPSSYWWILAKMYMFKSKVIDAVGPEEVEPLAIFNVIKFCKLFNPNVQTEVDKLIQLRHRLMHSENNHLTETELNDNFGLIKTFLQQVADNPTETLDEVEKLKTSTLVLYDENGEFSEKIKEALQLQGESLTADLKSPEGIRGATITSLAASNMTIKQQKVQMEESEKKHNIEYEALKKQKEQQENTYKDREKQLHEQYKDVLTKNEQLEMKLSESEKKLAIQYEELMKLKEFQIHRLEGDLQYEIEKNKAYEVNIKEFKENITHLSQECKQRKTELCSLDEKMEKIINYLKQEKSKNDKEISSLKSTKLQMEKEISDLKEEKSKQDDDIYSLKSTVLQTEESINDLKQEKSKQYEELSLLTSTMEKEVKYLKEEKSKQDGVISHPMIRLSINQTYQVQPANDVIVRVDSDENECCIRDMCQMSDGTVILLDFYNSKLKRLDDKFNVKDVYKFDETPVSVVSVSSSQVVVLHESGKLTYLTILDKIVHEKSLALEEIKLPEYLIYCKDQFWILCGNGIRIYSLSGSFVKQILNDSTMYHGFSGCRVLVTNEEKTRVYFVNGSTVSVLDPDGEILYTFKLRNHARAITVTTDDKLMVLEYRYNNVVVYDTEGKNLGLLISCKSLLSTPNSLFYDGKKSCLIVGFGWKYKVKVFQLNK